MNKIEYNNILNNDVSLVERALIQNLPKAKDGQVDVLNAMNYSLSNGGKRIRPILALEFAMACGGSRDDCLVGAKCCCNGDEISLGAT